MSVADRLSALSPEQRALFEKLRARPAVRTLPPVRSVSGPTGVGDWPLSFDQERLLQLHRDHPGLVSWNVDAGSRVLGELDVPRFLAAFRALIRRHAAWRTTFPVVDGRPVQRVHPWVEPQVSILDVSALPAAAREPAGLAAIYEHTRQPFDLENGPLLRIALVRLAERDHLYLVTIHHTATDWIAFQIFFGELVQVYEGVALPSLPVQFPDYALWEREHWQGEVLEEEARFWRKELEGFPLVLDLPGDRPRPPVQSQRGGLLRVQVGAERTGRLRSLARQEGATLFMAVLAVLDALLWRVTGREKIVVGSNAANRPRPELMPVAGFFLTQVPFATDVSGDPTFRELLARCRKTALSAYAHQTFPFSKLIEALGLPPDPSRNLVVQVLLLILEGESHGRSGDLEFRPVGLYDGNSRWDLMFGLYDYQDVGLTGPLEYNADVFDPDTVARLLELFYRTIDAVTADPDLRLSRLAQVSGSAPSSKAGNFSAR
jgi:hypothetical protein